MRDPSTGAGGVSTSRDGDTRPLYIAVTMNTYTKVVTALNRDAAKRIDALVNDLDT